MVILIFDASNVGVTSPSRTKNTPPRSLFVAIISAVLVNVAVSALSTGNLQGLSRPVIIRCKYTRSATLNDRKSQFTSVSSVCAELSTAKASNPSAK